MQLSTVTPPPPATRPAGDDAAVGSRTLLTSELLCESVDLRAGERVLDVACGSGNAALAAARRCCRVVGVDDAPELLARARRRAEAEGLEVTFLPGHPEDLPFPDGSFGELSAAIGRHLPRPAGLEPPVPRAGQERLRQLFGPEVAITAPRCSLLWRFPSAGHQVEFLGSFHGPTVEALRALGPDRAGALKAELLGVARRFDVSEDDTLVLRLDYLEVVVRKPLWV